MKVDFCGGGQQGLDPRVLYTRFARALEHNSSHRRLFLNVCNFWTPGRSTAPALLPDSAYANAQWAPRSRRAGDTDTDIGFTRASSRSTYCATSTPTPRTPRPLAPDTTTTRITWGTARHDHRRCPNAVHDVGDRCRTADHRQRPPRPLRSTVAMLENSEVIAIDQDPLDRQGTLVQTDGSGQVWAKPLADGDFAVALLNRGSTHHCDHHERGNDWAPGCRLIPGPETLDPHRHHNDRHYRGARSAG